MKRILLCVCMAGFLSLQCTHDKPLPSGFDDLQRAYKGEVKTLQVSAVDNGQFWDEPVSGLATSILLGKLGEAQSYLLLKFTDFSAVDTSNIKSMTVYLHQVGHYGNDAVPFTAVVHPVTGTWDESTVVWSEAKSICNATTEWTRFQVPATDSAWVSFTLDSTVVENWIRNSSSNYGLFIDFSSANFMARFLSTDYSTDVCYSQVIFTTSAGVLDTATVYAATDASLLQNLRSSPAQTLEKNNDRVWVDNAAGYRALLRFNLNDLPANATIHRALLSLFVDTENSYTHTDGLMVTCDAVVGDSLWNPLLAASDTLSTYPTAYGYDDDATLDFSGSAATTAMSVIVQNWVLKTTPNYGVILTGSYGYDPQRLSIYTGQDHPEYTPKLSITYSLPPSTKF